MKKIVPVLMVMVMALSFAGCGKKDGFGATKKTYFFDYTVNSAYVCSEFEGYQPAEGNELLVAEVTAQWGGTGDEDFSVPITYDGTEEGLAPLNEEQLPGIYTLAKKGESRTGLLVFEVPAGNKEFSISYMEAFDDDSTGDTYFVNFTAEAK